MRRPFAECRCAHGGCNQRPCGQRRLSRPAWSTTGAGRRTIEAHLGWFSGEGNGGAQWSARMMRNLSALGGHVCVCVYVQRKRIVCRRLCSSLSPHVVYECVCPGGFLRFAWLALNLIASFVGMQSSRRWSGELVANAVCVGMSECRPGNTVMTPQRAGTFVSANSRHRHRGTELCIESKPIVPCVFIGVFFESNTPGFPHLNTDPRYVRQHIMRI